MASFGNLVQKAFYLGVGLATAAGEQAGERLAELRVQAQKVADELVAKGEMTTEEARKLVDDIVQQAQQQPPKPPSNTSASEPRRIEIVSDDEEESSTTGETQDVDALRQKVQAMQEELRRLRRE
jgi:polyhydroxyalkanoate synthesis regulator phasin